MAFRITTTIIIPETGCSPPALLARIYSSTIIWTSDHSLYFFYSLVVFVENDSGTEAELPLHALNNYPLSNYNKFSFIFIFTAKLDIYDYFGRLT